MANNNSRNPGPSVDQILDAANIIREGIVSRADAYLDGEYNPTEKVRSTFVKGTTTAILVLSLITGLAFSGPSEINEEQTNSQLNRAPIVMDIDDYMNTGVEDDDDADEQKGAKQGVVAKFKQAVLNLPAAVRLLIITPLWAIGTALMTMVSFLWNIIFSTPLGAFIASFAVGFAVLFGLFVVTVKMLFPGVSLRRLISKRNVLVLGIAALLLAVVDWIAPVFWHDYPLASAGVKLSIAIIVISTICMKIKSVLGKESKDEKEKYKNLPDPAV